MRRVTSATSGSQMTRLNVVQPPRVTPPPHSSVEDILRERFARGEMTADQFDEAKKRLS